MTSAPSQLKTDLRPGSELSPGPEGPASRPLVWVSWTHVAGAAAYLIFLASRFPRVVDALYWISDLAFASVLVDDLASTAPGGVIKVGPAPHYTTIWYLYLTHWVPFRRVVWEWTPFVVAIAAVALISWACWRVAGRWAATFTFAIGISANTPVAATTLPQGLRSHTWLTIAILVAFVVFALERSRSWSPKTTAAAIIGLGAVAGATLASDPLFAVSGLVPFLGASFIVWLVARTRESRRLLITSGGIVAAGAGTAAVALAGMDRLGFTRLNATKVGIAPLESMLGNLRLLVEGTLYLTNGLFYRQPSVLRAGASFVVALGVLAVAGAAFVTVVRSLTTRAKDEKSQQLLGYVVFWVLASLMLGGAFVFTDFATGWGLPTSRYLIPVFLAVSALAPLAAGGMRWRRPAAAFGACILSLLSAVSIYESRALADNPVAEELSRARDFLAKEGLSTGYTAYWNSHAFTYHTGFEIRAYPIMECGSPPTRRYCPFWINTRSTWYEPRRNVRTFVITGRPFGPPELQSPPPQELGRPLKSKSFGSSSVYIYDYDIASRFGPPHEL